MLPVYYLFLFFYIIFFNENVRSSLRKVEKCILKSVQYFQYLLKTENCYFLFLFECVSSLETCGPIEFVPGKLNKSPGHWSQGNSPLMVFMCKTKDKLLIILQILLC